MLTSLKSPRLNTITRPRLTTPSPQAKSTAVSEPSFSPSGEAPLDQSGSDRVATITAGLFENFAPVENRGQKAENRDKQDLQTFKESLDPAAREAFVKLDGKKQLEVMRLGKAFPGTTIKDSPLIKMMKDGRLFEKDLDGATPLQTLTDASKPKRRDFQGKRNFVERVLGAVENPSASKDAQARGDSASVQPAGFIRKAGDEYNRDLTLNRPSSWDNPAA